MRLIKGTMAAALAVAATAGMARAQGRIDTGTANDANNRIGSGGYNANGYVGPRYTGNDIVYGNVTRGLGFTGPVPYRDPRAFTGPSPSRSLDTFVGNSSGGGYYGYGGSNSNASVARPFYGDGRAVAPPQGYVSQGYSGGNVPSSTPPPRSGSDLRLGNPLSNEFVPSARPGQLILPGPVDPSNGDLLLTASPLYGARAWRLNNMQDQQFLQQYTDLYGNNSLMGRSTLDDAQMQKYRAELFGAAPTSAKPINNAITPTSANATDQNAAGQGTASANAGTTSGNLIAPTNLSQPLPAAPETPGNEPLSNAVVPASDQGPNGLQTNQSLTQRVIPPAQQSAQYATLQQRLKRYYADKQLTDADRARIYNEQKRQLDADKAKREQVASSVNPKLSGQETGAPGAGTVENPTPTANPGATPGLPGAPADQNAPAIPRPTSINPDTRQKPPQVPSLGGLIKAKGVSDILKKAEDLMRQGKYIDALDQYDTAEQIGAKFAAVQLGRANAELGASYYTRAESDIRQAFTQDPSLLQAQYDLTGMIGEDRLQFLVKDLKEIANKEKTQTRPVFLLAYIAYNTGNERMALGYLDLAEKRSGGSDPFYKTVRENWTLPTGESRDPGLTPEPAPATQPELNK